ncbi:fibronectin type III domain-containing protein [bacterium]|nr:fibronectin type III domain-containing protein [bacterium]
MNRAAMIATLALGLLAAPPLSAQLVEQGSLRGFLLGSEPAAAYDNWYSHTVEGLSEAGGYNDYIPASIDSQNNNFGEYSLIPEEQDEAAREVWIPVFNALLEGNPTTAQLLLNQAQLPFDAVRFEDNETGRTFYLVRERLDSTFVDSSGTPDDVSDDIHGSFRKGWGVFITCPGATMPSVMAQVPHPNDDYIALPIALELLLRGNFGALIVNGTGREVEWFDNYSNSLSLSDPTRYPHHPFNYFCEAFVSRMRQQGELDMTIQLHSYDTASHPNSKPVMISPGPADEFPNRPIYDRSPEALDWINFTPSVPVPSNAIYDGQAAVPVINYYAVAWQNGLRHMESLSNISPYVDLPGYGGNIPMEIVAEGIYPEESVDRFVHVEFDELPGVIEDAGVLEDSLYGASIPPDLATWEPMLLYYDAAIEGLITALEDIYLVPDERAPTAPGDLLLTYSSDLFANVRWTLSTDPNFYTYEIYYDTDFPVDLNSPKIDLHTIPALTNMLTDRVRLEPLLPETDYQVAIRALDRAGNVTPLSAPLELFTQDNTNPTLRDEVFFNRFPVDAWPPAFSCEVSSIEPLAYVVVDVEVNGQDLYSLPLNALEEWEEGDYIEFGLTGAPHPRPHIQAGDHLRYQYRTRDVSLHTEETVSEWFSAELNDGQHFYEANLEHSDGGLQPGGDPGWEWGIPEGGPGSGEDGDYAWFILDPPPGTTSLLTLPGPFLAQGVNQLYLVMDVWYDTDETGYASEATAGFWLETPYDEFWRLVDPIDDYPSFVDTPGPYHTDCLGGHSDGWKQVIFELDYYINEEFELRLHFTSLSSDIGSVGAAVDNIRLTSQPPQLPAPTNITISRYSDTGLRVSWNRNGATLYRIYRGPTPSGPMEVIGETSSSSYIDREVLTSGGESFYYRVTAVLR